MSISCSDLHHIETEVHHPGKSALINDKLGDSPVFEPYDGDIGYMHKAKPHNKSRKHHTRTKTEEARKESVSKPPRFSQSFKSPRERRQRRAVTIAASDDNLSDELINEEIRKESERSKKNIRRLVAIIGISLTLLSILLVAGSLYLSSHIDKLVEDQKKSETESTTQDENNIS